MIKRNIKNIIKTTTGTEIDLNPYKKAGEAIFNPKIQKILTVWGIFFVILACCYKFILPDFIKPENVSQILYSTVNEGYELNIKNMKTDLSWDLALVLDADEVLLSNSKNKILQSRKTTLKIPLIMLLLKSFDDFKFNSDYVDAFLERDSQGNFNIQKAFKAKSSADKIKKFRIAVKDYNINFTDQNTAPIVLNGYNLDFGNLNLYRLKTFGTISFPDGEKTILNINFISKKPISKGNFVLKGDVANLDLSKIEKYLCEFFPDITKACGKINGDFNIDAYGRQKLTNNLKASLNTNNIQISTKKYPHFFEIKDNAQIFAEGKYYNCKLYFKNFRLISRDYNLDLKGKIKNLNKRHKNIDIKIKSKNSNAKKIIGLVPKTAKIRHDNVNKAIKHNLDAIINCDLRIKGNTNTAKYYGNVNIKNFVINENIEKSKSKINLSYKNRKVTLNAKLFDSLEGLVNLSGSTILGDIPKVDLKVFSKNFQLDEFKTKMLVTADLLELSPGILQDLTISGNGKLNATIKGEGKKTSIDGHLEIFNSVAKYSKLAKPAQINSAKIKLQGRKFIFDDFESFIDSNKVHVNGFTSIDKETDALISASKFPLSLGIFILQNSELFEKAGKEFSKIDFADGNIDFNFRLLSENFNPKKSIYAKGSIDFKQNSIKFNDFSSPINNIYGKILCEGTDYILQNFTGNVLNSSIKAEGKIKNQLLNIKLSVPNVDFSQTVPTILTSKACSDIAPFFSKIKNPSGTFAAILYLKGKIDSNFLDEIKCNNFNIKFSKSAFPPPVNIKSGELTVTKNELHAKNIIFNILNSKGTLDGKITGLPKKPNYNLILNVYNIDKISFEEMKKYEFSPPVKKILESLDEFSGSASGLIKIGKTLNGKINFNNIGFKYTPLALPLKIKTGELIIKNDRFYLPNSQIYVGNSKFKMSVNYNKNTGVEFDFSGNLTPEELDKFNKNMLYPVNLKKSAPIKLKIQNNKSSGLKFIFGTFLKPENAFSYKGISVGDTENFHVVGGGVSSFNDLLHFNNFGVCQYKNAAMAELGFTNPLLPKNFLQISGWINKKSLEENLHVFSRDFINANLLNEFISNKFSNQMFQNGFVKGDITLQGRIDTPKLIGKAELRNVKIPVFKMDILTLYMDFTDDLIYLKNGIVKIADSELAIEGTIENVIEIPYVFKNLKISSNYINLDQIIKIFNKEGLPSDNLPFLTVKKGEVSSQKLILNNLATNDAQAKFTFTPDWIMSLDKFVFNSAGGEVSGNMTLNFLSFENKTYLKFKNLKANAVTSTLLQMPNEIYGLLNGEANFSSKGLTRSELIKNSNGNVKFQITSGRLVRLGSLEYLLMAAEVMKSGITGLCINNVCTLLAPYKNGAFDTINVDFKVKNGVLFTDYLVSRSKNLSVYLTGSFDMATNYSDFTILGRISKSVINVLGPVGNFSINKVLNVIPGENNSENSLLNNLNKFPGVDFNDKTFRRFLVNIEGDLYDQKSVKNFRWID